jgi:uncharacterized protein
VHDRYARTCHHLGVKDVTGTSGEKTTVIQHKIVLSGPVGAGKTTAIHALSDGSALSTDATASDVTGAVKDLTTVALDHGAFNLDNGDRVHLFGTPGQDRFDYMWEILSEGANGLVLLVPNDHVNPLSQLRFFVRSFAPLVNGAAIAVGVTHTDLSSLPTLDEYHQLLTEMGLPNAPVHAVDARQPDDVRRLILDLLFPRPIRTPRHARETTF